MENSYSNFLVFISLILAAAVTEILSSLGSYIRNYKYIKFSFFISGWGFLTLLAMIQYWYAIVLFNDEISTYLFDDYLIDISSAIFFYLLSRVILPDFSSCSVSNTIDSARENRTEKYDLDCYFYRNILFMYGLAAILILLSDINDRFYTIWHEDTEIYRSSFRVGFLAIVCFGWIASFFEKKYPNKTQKDLTYHQRKFVGIGYIVNMLMWIIFLIFFVAFIVAFFY